MEEENDFLRLSIEDRCQHKLWKARVSGYEDAAKLFHQQDDEKSPEFQKYVGLLKKFVIDSNAVAQEKGLSAVLAFVGNAASAPKTVGDVLGGIITKCFSSPRAKTRELALEITLMYIEIEKQDVVLDELIKGLENKSPKVVAACIIALRESLHLFGSQVIAIKPLVKILTKLLEDRDKTVREESKMLCVEIYRWVGEAIKPQLQTLKPVTELEELFKKTTGERVVATRYLRSQQEKIAKAKEESADSVEIQNVVDTGPPQVDAYDLMTAVDILSKLPKNFYEQCEAKKWQERKEVLEILLQLTTNVKLEAGDYGDLVRVLKKFVAKDSNVLVVALAAKCLTNLVQGLRKKFQPYASACIPTIFEKFKEKKQNVVVALREAIDALYSISSLDAMLEDIQTALDSKNPQVKAETCAFLTRCFCSCLSTQLNKKLLKAFTISLLKTLNDTDSAVRENSAEALGTALKVAGEKMMSPFLQEIDAIKMAKVKEFCDKAVVTAKPQQSQQAQKKPVSAPVKPAASIKSSEESIPKSVMGGAKKTISGIVKPKSAPAQSKAVRSTGVKKGGGEPIEPEFKEQELTDEDVMTQASEILTDDVVSGICSSNWKDRLAAVEKFYEVVQQIEKGNIPAQVLIKLLAKKPGFKENNFQILKLRFEVLTYIAENSQISHTSVESCLSDVVDKIGDAKNGVFAGSALTALAEATSLDYVSLEVLNLAFNQRNPRNQSEAILWVSNAIKQFGLKVNVKEIIDYTKKAFSSTNPAVRNSALALVGIMYMYVGKNLRSFFEDEKPSLLQQIDSELEKMKDVKPPQPEKGKINKQAGSSRDATESSKGDSQQVNLADLMPRVDISSQITQQLLSDLSDKDWHLRSDALQKISGIISDAKFVSPNLGDLPNALKPRLADTNKKLGVQALSICQMLGVSLGPHCSKQIRNFAPGILICLGDNKAHVRAAALQCLDSWMENCPLTNLFEGEMIFDVLKSDNPFLRIELFGWLAERLPTVTSLPTSELNLCVPILLGCLEDRNVDVRKKASECLLPFMIHVGYESMSRAASKLKPASKNTVIAQLEKVRQNLPEKPSNKSKQAKPIPSERSSPPQVPEDGIKGKLNRSSSKSKLALKAASASKGKKEEEIDTSPSLVLNNMKDQRMLDEKALKILKWNFTTPREEFYIQLKDQMTAANWSKTLISHCFHNDFKYHIKAIDLLIESLESSVEASAANLDLILKWLALRFFDTNPSVLIKSLEYLQALFQALSAINYRLLELEAASFVPYLILKIGDSKDPVRKGVREILKIIGKIYPSSKMFSYIMQGLSSKNARQRAECLEELGSMIEMFGLNVCQPSPSAALKEIARQISDRDNSVRNASLNCFVQAYFIEGDKVYKYVGQLSDKDMSLLEERIKRSAKTRTVKPPESKPVVSAASSPPANLNVVAAAAAAVEESHKTSQGTVTRNQPSGPLRLETDDIEQMFRHKQSDFETPRLVKVNADDILNLPDIQLPPTRLRPPASSLKLLNNSAEANTAVNLVMAQLAAQEIPVVVEAFAQVEEVLKQSEQAIAVLGPRVDQLLVMGAMQYRYAHTKHMADENICKADVIRLYRCVTVALVTLFDNPVLAKKASRDVLRDLIPHLLTVMLDTRLDDLQEGAQVVKVINVLIMRVLQKSNPTHVLSALIKLLHDCVGSVNVSDRFTDLVMKCLWKNIRLIRQVINELNIDRILLDVHVFLKTFPSSSWKERKDDTPIRTVKTILYRLVEIKDEDIMKHLSLITDRQESDLVSYLHKLLAKRKGDSRKALNKNATLDDNRHKRSKSSPLKLSKSTHEALTEIFKKIGSKEQTNEGISELYDFTQKHPEADIEPYLKNSSEFFRNYIRQGIKDLERKRNTGSDSPVVKSRKSEEWNSNLAGNDSIFKERTGSQSWQEKFPPLPPPTIDTTPMDLVEWLKNVVARLGMDTSKYDDPAFLEKIMCSDNEGNVDENIAQMFADIERYKKILQDLKNAA